MAKHEPASEDGRFVQRMLAVIETVGNALPHPATLFSLKLAS